MNKLGLERSVVDEEVRNRSVAHLRERKVRLPTFHELAYPETLPEALEASLEGVDPDAPDPRNLFRVHWYNGTDRRHAGAVPNYFVVPKALTGVAAPIVVLLGDRFPLIQAHKVLAAYGCLVPRIVTGQFDPARHRALWPSTGNYCRGGVAISRILGCRGVAILPEGMSRERFQWLERWVQDPTDIVRTPGTESNVKEIYDRCAELERDSLNVIFNQFCEFGNHLVHRSCTGRALEVIVESLQDLEPELTPALFVSATGSAGTLAAGEHLQDRYRTRVAAVEATECPTLLRNGFGEHNIQGIGDKHVPYIHNVMATDVVVGVSDRSTDHALLLFNTPSGKKYLQERHGLSEVALEGLTSLGPSGIANVMAAIKCAKHFRLGEHEMVLTVATDNASLYRSEVDRILLRDFPRGLDDVHAGEIFGEHLRGQRTDDLLELRFEDRERIFNLGYFTWVEQQGVPLSDFLARKSQRWWRDLQQHLSAWDELIRDFNARVESAS